MFSLLSIHPSTEKAATVSLFIRGHCDVTGLSIFCARFVSRDNSILTRAAWSSTRMLCEIGNLTDSRRRKRRKIAQCCL